MPIPVSLTLTFELDHIGRRLRLHDADGNVAFFGEFDGVSDQIRQNLPEAHRIADGLNRQFRMHVAGKSEPFQPRGA